MNIDKLFEDFEISQLPYTTIFPRTAFRFGYEAGAKSQQEVIEKLNLKFDSDNIRHAKEVIEKEERIAKMRVLLCRIQVRCWESKLPMDEFLNNILEEILKGEV